MTDDTGSGLASRPVDVVVVVDASGSMVADGKIQSLNTAMQEALPSLRSAFGSSPGIDPMVAVVTFGDDAAWKVFPPVPLTGFLWPDIAAEEGALSELGRAIDLVAASLDDRPGVVSHQLILLTDGMPTDCTQPTFDEALASLDAHSRGRLGGRVAVGIGEDADAASLERFVGAVNGSVLTAQDPHRLAEQIRLAGSTVLSDVADGVW